MTAINNTPWSVAANGINVRTGSTSLVQLQVVRDPQRITPDRYLPASGADAEAAARLIAAAPALLSLLRRWRALDAGAWHAERHASDKADLEQTTDCLLATLTEALGD
jgi:hypothetical protein